VGGGGACRLKKRGKGRRDLLELWWKEEDPSFYGDKRKRRKNQPEGKRERRIDSGSVGEKKKVGVESTLTSRGNAHCRRAFLNRETGRVTYRDNDSSKGERFTPHARREENECRMEKRKTGNNLSV